MILRFQVLTIILLRQLFRVKELRKVTECIDCGGPNLVNTNGLIACLTEPSQMNALDLINSDRKDRKKERGTEEGRNGGEREKRGSKGRKEGEKEYSSQEYSAKSFIK